MNGVCEIIATATELRSTKIPCTTRTPPTPFAGGILPAARSSESALAFLRPSHYPSADPILTLISQTRSYEQLKADAGIGPAETDRLEARVGIEPTNRGFADLVGFHDKELRINSIGQGRLQFVRFLSACMREPAGRIPTVTVETHRPSNRDPRKTVDDVNFGSNNRFCVIPTSQKLTLSGVCLAAPRSHCSMPKFRCEQSQKKGGRNNPYHRKRRAGTCGIT
jgi:hypothetical protein